MFLKFAANHAVACKRGIRANIFKSAALEEQREQTEIHGHSGENKVTKDQERET